MTLLGVAIVLFAGSIARDWLWIVAAILVVVWAVAFVRFAAPKERYGTGDGQPSRQRRSSSNEDVRA